jgi:hypothetical protein
MSKHEKRFDAKDSHAIFEPGNNLRADHISSHSRDKYSADRLIENELHGYTRISTCQYAEERMVLEQTTLSSRSLGGPPSPFRGSNRTANRWYYKYRRELSECL